MIVATGRVSRHVGALADRVVKDLGMPAMARPGSRARRLSTGFWSMRATSSSTSFRPEVRAFYNLEKMWSAGRPSEPSAVRRAPERDRGGSAEGRPRARPDVALCRADPRRRPSLGLGPLAILEIEESRARRPDGRKAEEAARLLVAAAGDAVIALDEAGINV